MYIAPQDHSSMIRTLLLLIVLPCCTGALGQDTSLTREFDNLSAKERSRIAKQEAEESARDVAFQEVMTEAEGLFRSRQYDDALERYTEARRMRPYNVYPKVKIQDLEALIAKRDAEVQFEQEQALVKEPPEEVALPAPGPAHVEPIPVPKEPEPEPVQMVPAPVPDPVSEEPLAPPRVATPAKEASTPVAPIRVVKASSPVPVVSEEPDGQRTEGVEVILHPPVIDGVQERVYRDGRAVVLERQVTQQGQTTVYKRVTHPYGEAVHFKDGVAITDRTWNEVFGD